MRTEEKETTAEKLKLQKEEGRRKGDSTPSLEDDRRIYHPKSRIGVNPIHMSYFNELLFLGSNLSSSSWDGMGSNIRPKKQGFTQMKHLDRIYSYPVLRRIEVSIIFEGRSRTFLPSFFLSPRVFLLLAFPLWTRVEERMGPDRPTWTGIPFLSISSFLLSFLSFLSFTSTKIFLSSPILSPPPTSTSRRNVGFC